VSGPGAPYPDDNPPTGHVAEPTPVSTGAGLLLGLQGVVALAAAVFWLVEAFVSDAASVLNVVMAVLLFALVGVGLLLVARDLVRRRRWARAPAVTWEVICLPVAYGLFQSGRWYVGLPLAVVALAVLVAVLGSSAAD
jgi:glycerol-3-phosphate acyltransferase PlsY